MATPATQFSLEHHLLDRLKYSGIEKENLADLISIVVSLRNKCRTAWSRASFSNRSISTN
jgi:hypothetical protein